MKIIPTNNKSSLYDIPFGITEPTECDGLIELEQQSPTIIEHPRTEGSLVSTESPEIEPTGQIRLFTKTDDTEQMWHLEKEISAHRETVSANCKKATNLIKALKEVNNIDFVFFKCHANKLAAETSELYAQQSAELAGYFITCRDSILAIMKMEPERDELRIKLGYKKDTTTGVWIEEVGETVGKIIAKHNVSPDDLEEAANTILNVRPSTDSFSNEQEEGII